MKKDTANMVISGTLCSKVADEESWLKRRGAKMSYFRQKMNA